MSAKTTLRRIPCGRCLAICAGGVLLLAGLTGCQDAKSPPPPPPPKTVLPATIEILELTDENFDERVAASETAVLVDLWAPWCGPCKMIAPHLEMIGREEHMRLTIAKVNVDENPQLNRRFVDRGIPTLVLMHRGEEVDRILGAVPLEHLRRWVVSRLDAL